MEWPVYCNFAAVFIHKYWFYEVNKNILECLQIKIVIRCQQWGNKCQLFFVGAPTLWLPPYWTRLSRTSGPMIDPFWA